MPTRHASSNEAHISEYALSPQNDIPSPTLNKPNQWCIDGEYQTYRDTKMLKDEMVTMERRVLRGILHTIRYVHILFTHILEWMAKSLGSYSDEIVKVFYASYVGIWCFRQATTTFQTGPTHRGSSSSLPGGYFIYLYLPHLVRWVH